MHRIAVIGEKDTVEGFKTLGLETFAVTGSSEAGEILRRLVNENFAVIYITEQTAEGIMDSIRELKSKILPAVILIPGNKGSLGIAMSEIKKSVEKAVGADILS